MSGDWVGEDLEQQAAVVPAAVAADYRAEAAEAREELRRDYVTVSEQVRGLVVSDQAGLDKAAELARGIQTFIKRVREKFAKPKGKAREAWQAVCNLESEMLGSSEEDLSTVKKAMGAWVDAEKLAATKRQQDQLEKDRKEAEDKRVADAANLETLANTTGDERYRKAAHAEIERPVMVPVRPVVAPKAAGTPFKTDKVVTVTDPRALCKAIGDGTLAVPDEVLEKVGEALRSWLKLKAKSDGKAFAVPGVRVDEQTNVTVRGR